MPHYRKKPVVVEAFRLNHESPPDWFLSAYIEGAVSTENGQNYINTLEGRMLIGQGDWIIKGVSGELYPCKHSIFEQTYEPA